MNAAKGNFDGPSQDYQIDANDQLVTSNDYRNVVVAYRNGAPVMLTDVAHIVNGVENNYQAAWMNQTPAVIVNVQRQPGANTISVVRSIKGLIPQLEANLPTGIQVTTLTDLTTAIEASVSDVEFELMLTIVLVVLVIFLFLRSLYATIIPSVAVPLSLVGTFGAMYALGYSLDNLSLMALTISTGFVVDDAIVMIENISRYIEAGDPPDGSGAQGCGANRIHHSLADRVADRRAHSAVIYGRRGRAAVSRVRGDACRHHHSFSGRFPDAHAHDERAYPAAHAGKRSRGASTRPRSAPSSGMIAFYGRTLKFVLRYQTITLLVALGTAAAYGLSVHHHPQGIFPGAGHRRHPGHLAGVADDWLDKPWPQSSRSLPRRFWKTRPSKAFRRLSARMARMSRPTAVECRSI